MTNHIRLVDDCIELLEDADCCGAKGDIQSGHSIRVEAEEKVPEDTGDEMVRTSGLEFGDFVEHRPSEAGTLEGLELILIFRRSSWSP